MGIDLNRLNKNVDTKKEGVSFVASLISMLNKDISFKGKYLKTKNKEYFFSELNILLSSGIDLKTSLEIIVEEQTKIELVEVFEAIKNKVIQGDSLSQAIKFTKRFSDYDYYSVKIGEESGNVSIVLEELSEFYSKSISQRRKITGALSYPIIVLLTAFGAIFFIMKFMIPMFIEIFARSNNNLPPLTQFIINFSGVFTRYIFVGVLFILVIVLFNYLLRKNIGYKLLRGNFLLKIPILGQLIKLFYLERLFQSMALMASSKVDLLKSLELGSKMINFQLLTNALTKIHHDILRGSLLNESLKQFPIFNKRTIYLIKVGEEVNKLDIVFKKLSSQYAEELNYKVEILISLLEPFLIIFVGSLVAVILIAMYLPMFQMGTNLF